MPTIEELAEQLDKHAKVINNLRRRVTDLENATSRIPLTDWSPPTTCAMCGKDKGSRPALTCAECSALRTRILREKLDRTPILRDTCHACGTGFTRATRFLCAGCSTSFKLWKASNK